MNEQDRQAIDGLFAKLNQVEGQAGPRDAEAEGFIAQRIARQPAAPYLMAQTIVMQDYALQQAQARIQELEQQAQEAPLQAAPGGGLFGSSQQPAPRRGSVPTMPRAGSPFGAGQAGAAPGTGMGVPPGSAAQGQSGAFGRPAGGGFLAGAAQTAMGVAGGVLLGNAIAGMFSGSGEANAAEAPADTGAEAGAHDDMGGDDISASDDGGFFGGGGWFGGDEEF